jgi:hypothetical protein
MEGGQCWSARKACRRWATSSQRAIRRRTVPRSTQPTANVFRTSFTDSGAARGLVRAFHKRLIVLKCRHRNRMSASAQVFTPMEGHETRATGTSASLIGRSGSSAFKLSTTAVSTSLAGSRFSSESAPGPFHHGIRGRGGTISNAVLPPGERQVQADMRTHLIHRPARDIIPPRGGTRAASYRM